ncbi:hypothetical protein QR685DRAFT_518477 [Neurospora intermedia]|uniref:Secreted protein n=1 Tax=Neurospora intermedia TaxID=5142 RepID=A0ABR3DN00_NEUIN
MCTPTGLCICGVFTLAWPAPTFALFALGRESSIKHFSQSLNSFRHPECAQSQLQSLGGKVSIRLPCSSPSHESRTRSTCTLDINIQKCPKRRP